MTTAGAGVTRADAGGSTDYQSATVPVVDQKSLEHGLDGGAVGTAGFNTGFDLFEDKDIVALIR